MRRVALVLVMALVPTGCFLFNALVGQPAEPPAPAAQPVDTQAEMRASLEGYRTQAQTGDAQAVLLFAALLAGVQATDENKAVYGEVDWAGLTLEAEGMLDVLASSGDPDVQLASAVMKAELQLKTGRASDAVATYQAFHERAPSFATAIGLMSFHGQAGIPMADAPGFCKTNRKLPEGDDQLYEYMKKCAELNPSDSLKTSVPWASKAELKLYARIDAELQAEQARREAEREAQWEADAQAQREADEREREREAMAASSSSSSSGSSGSSGSSAPSSVSVTLRNTCSSTVQVFFGDKPKFGSGKYSSLSSNSSTGMSFRPGDMIWIVDDSQNGLASATVSASTRTIEVTSGCTGLSSR